MLKRCYSRKIFVSSAVLFALLLVCLIPKQKLYTLEDVKNDTVYVNTEANLFPIYLLDKNKMVARTKVSLVNTEVNAKIKELIQILIQGGEGENKIPSGFQATLPAETKLNSIQLSDGLLKLEFSKEFLNTTAELEEKMVSSLVYTVTSIEEVKQVILYVDGNILTFLPKSKKYLPSTLNRSFGVNKEYDLTSFENIKGVTIYYVGKYNNDIYYVPVTKYTNSSEDKIKIIISELAAGPNYHSGLMSFLNSNTKLLANSQESTVLSLTFNDSIFNNLEDQNILEEVINTISLSVGDNFDVKEVDFKVNDKEIYKSVIKTLE